MEMKILNIEGSSLKNYHREPQSEDTEGAERKEFARWANLAKEPACRGGRRYSVFGDRSSVKKSSSFWVWFKVER
jgi:hypothetical protein